MQGGQVAFLRMGLVDTLMLPNDCQILLNTCWQAILHMDSLYILIQPAYLLNTV